MTKQTDSPKSSRAADEPSRDPTLLSGRVLVVDDDADYRRIVGLRMENVGCRCHFAGTHDEALRLLLRHPEIEATVLDYHMRGEDIASLVGRIRELRSDVVLVGHSSMERAKHFAALGVDRFLLKPWTPEDLWDVLRKDGR